MKRQSRLSFTSIALCTLAVVMPQSVFAAGASSSEVLIVAQASKAEMQDTDEGKAEKDTQPTKQVKHPGKPKQVGRKGGQDPKARAAKRETKIKLIQQDYLQGSRATAAAQKEPAAQRKEAKKAMSEDNDMSDTQRDTELMKEAKQEPKPKEAGRGNRYDSRIRAKRRKAKMKLLAKDYL